MQCVMFRLWRQGKWWFSNSVQYKEGWLARISTVCERKIWTSYIYWE